MNVKVIMSRKEIEEEQKRKYVKLNGVNIKLQLDAGSDIFSINVLTRKQIGSPLLKKKLTVARGAKKLNFKEEFICHFCFLGKKLKLKMYVLQNILNLFGSDCIVLLELWQLPINFYCNRVDASSKSKNKETEKLVEDLKNSFPRVFLEGLGK